MTAHRMAWVDCDATEDDDSPCQATTLGDLYVQGATPDSKAAARTDAARQGWARRGNLDLCPHHANQRTHHP